MRLKKFQTIIMVMIAFMVPLFLGEYISPEIKAFIYSISLTIKSGLLFILPLIIFVFISSSLTNLGVKAIRLVILLIGCIFASNLTAIMTGYFVGYKYISMFSDNANFIISSEIELQPLWTLSLKPLLSNEVALFGGFFLGAYLTYKPNRRINLFISNGQEYAHKFLKNVFIPILPIFIMGFVFKFEHEGLLVILLEKFKNIFFVVVLLQISYIAMWLMVASRGNIRTFGYYVRNLIPVYITGLSTISSAATMPVNMIAAERNLRNSVFARTIIPATVNIHTIGSAISFTILSLATMWAFSIPLPDFYHFMLFAIPYALAKYSVAGVPGGVVVVALPLLVKYLGFTPEMAGIIAGVYLLFDPFGTAANVVGNGVFAILFYDKFGKHYQEQKQKPVKLTN